jgi:Mannosylglycerate hydrolase MGH1-like glycoside hydrolase domain/Glycosyl hydrolase family 63 C-terminal domain
MARQQSRRPPTLSETIEGKRTLDASGARQWRRWGPYLGERQWGTVREDYSPNGTAWEYFPHDHARSRAYRWGEDGLGGFADEGQHWCLAVGLWNGRDPILKERLFGLTNSEGNHGEDVKEAYYYSDGIPSHAYMRMLYKYPQEAFPYARLVAANRSRGVNAAEFELDDTGVFDAARYFDVTIEYAKHDPDDILMRVTVENRGPDSAALHVLPQLWARNTWSWSETPRRPTLTLVERNRVEASHPHFMPMRLDVDGRADLLFCENDTNVRRHFGIDAPGPFKDGFDSYIVHGDGSAVNPAGAGTKCAAHFQFNVQPGQRQVLRLRFRPSALTTAAFDDFDSVFASRRAEADEFYASLQRDIQDADRRLVQRQALAGMLWSKQYYYIDIPQWLSGDAGQPAPPASRQFGRNTEWEHLNNADVIAMPDKWEYPWYAAWDLAFHCVTFALIDPEFAKSQLVLLTREWYMHPNGQLPAYEWAFGDVNPPVHAWATWRVYQMDRTLRGHGDRDFLERVFHKLILNFNWWVNRKDAHGRNVFQGGFLGLDNIGIFDRSSPLPTGGYINQSDGTAWMAMYALNLMRIALELSRDNHVYEDIATKFFEHFLYIAAAMTRMGGEQCLWDDQDEFFYDVLNLPGDRSVPLRVRSMVGLIPLYAVHVLDAEIFELLPDFTSRLKWFLNYRPDLAKLVSRWTEPAHGERHLLSLLRGHRMKRLLKRALDATEFLSEYGIRALSRTYSDNPYVFEHEGHQFSVGYVPGESATTLFGGNSNWRGPIWMPVNYLLIESLYEFHRYYGEDFKVECPTGSGQFLTLREVAEEISRRLGRIFLRDSTGRRPVFGDNRIAQEDPAFRDHLLFYEYFHGDTGRGVGASHQTGWTGLVALLLHPRTKENPCAFNISHIGVGEHVSE